MGQDITFTAGLNPSQFEKGVARIEELGKRAAKVNMDGMGGRSRNADPVADRSKGIIEQVARFAVLEKAAKTAFRVASDGVREYAKHNAGAARELSELERAINRQQEAIGRVIVTSGALRFVTTAINEIGNAWTNVTGAVARYLIGGDYDYFNKMQAEAEAIEKHAKAMVEVDAMRQRLRANNAASRGDERLAVELRAAEQYRQELQRIAAIEGIRPDESQELRVLAFRQKELAMDAHAARMREAEDRARKASQQEQEAFHERLTTQLHDEIAKRADALKLVESAGVESLRARGLDEQAKKVQILLDLEERLARIRANELGLADRARATDAIAQAARDQIAAADRDAAKRAMGGVRNRVLQSGLASGANIAQVFGRGGASGNTVESGVKSIEGLLRQLVGKVRTGEIFAVLGP
jgi:hypothetical protein